MLRKIDYVINAEMAKVSLLEPSFSLFEELMQEHKSMLRPNHLSLIKIAWITISNSLR